MNPYLYARRPTFREPYVRVNRNRFGESKIVIACACGAGACGTEDDPCQPPHALNCPINKDAQAMTTHPAPPALPAPERLDEWIERMGGLPIDRLVPMGCNVTVGELRSLLAAAKRLGEARELLSDVRLWMSTSLPYFPHPGEANQLLTRLGAFLSPAATEQAHSETPESLGRRSRISGDGT